MAKASATSAGGGASGAAVPNKPLTGTRIFICKRGVADLKALVKLVEFLGGTSEAAVSSSTTHVLTGLKSMRDVLQALGKLPPSVTCHDLAWLNAAKSSLKLPGTGEFRVV